MNEGRLASSHAVKVIAGANGTGSIELIFIFAVRNGSKLGVKAHRFCVYGSGREEELNLAAPGGAGWEQLSRGGEERGSDAPGQGTLRA